MWHADRGIKHRGTTRIGHCPPWSTLYYRRLIWKSRKVITPVSVPDCRPVASVLLSNPKVPSSSVRPVRGIARLYPGVPWYMTRWAKKHMLKNVNRGVVKSEEWEVEWKNEEKWGFRMLPCPRCCDNPTVNRFVQNWLLRFINYIVRMFDRLTF